MFFIKNRSFRVFQENYTLLPFDRSPKSSETSHFRCCEICYWQQDVSDDPKRRIHRKNAEIIRFLVSHCQWETLICQIPDPGFLAGPDVRPKNFAPPLGWAGGFFFIRRFSAPADCQSWLGSGGHHNLNCRDVADPLQRNTIPLVE